VLALGCFDQQEALMQFIRIDGELAEIVPTGSGRAKLVYFTCEPEGRLPTEVEYRPLHLGGSDGIGRLSLKNPDVLLIERFQPRFLDAFNPRKLVGKLLAKFGFERSHA
jgi:hypothetical protein